MFMRFPGGIGKAVTLSYDDGVETDIRLCEIMKKNGLRGTFNINGGCFAKEGTTYPAGTVSRRMSLSQCLEAYNDPAFEVALHGYKHPSFAQMPTGMAAYDIIKDREALEAAFGKVIRGLAYPNGSYNDEVIAMLKSCGVAYARTTGTGNFNLPEEWMRWSATCHHADTRLMDFARRFADQKIVKDPQVLYVWGHSYEFDGANNWHIIEEFAEFIGHREDIWYATNIEIYDYTTAFRRLECSADGTYVYNPSAIPVTFTHNGKMFTVSSGETIKTK